MMNGITTTIRKYAEPLLLTVILVLAFFIAYIPHSESAYPVHLDEWVHIAHSNEIFTEETVLVSNPFDGSEMKLFDRMELGYQLFLGIVRNITGIEWNLLSRFLPSFLFMATVLAVYIFARKEGFGWEAALLTCLIPTNVGILGPGFMVPVALALFFAPLIMYIAFNHKSIPAYLVILVFIIFLVSVHGPSAICTVLIMAPYIIMNIRKDTRHSLWLATVLILPFIVSLPVTYPLVNQYIGEIFTGAQPISGHDLPEIIRYYGYIPVAVVLIGIFVLAYKGGRRKTSLVLGLVVMAVMLTLFNTIQRGIAIVYLRGFLFSMLLMSIIGGAALHELRCIKLPEKLLNNLKIPFINRYLGIGLAAVLIGVIFGTSIPERMETEYYRVIDDEDYASFTWIRDNLDDSYDKAILDPWKANAFTAITGRHVYTRIHMGSTTKSDAAYDFLENLSKDTTFLQENDLSLVYSRVYLGPQSEIKEKDFVPENPDLIPVTDYTYILHDPNE